MTSHWNTSVSQREYEIQLQKIVEKRRKRCREANQTYHETTSFAATIKKLDQVKRKMCDTANQIEQLYEVKRLKISLAEKLMAFEAITERVGMLTQNQQERMRQIRLWLSEVDRLMLRIVAPDQVQQDKLVHSSTIFNYMDQGNNLGARGAMQVTRKDLSELDDIEIEDNHMIEYFDIDDEENEVYEKDDAEAYKPDPLSDIDE